MSDPLIPPWEMCKVCGGDHWTNQHAEIRPDLAALKWEIIRGAVFEQFGVDLNDEFDRLHKIEKVATDISRRTYVDDGVVAHVPFYKLYALRQALFGSDEEIVAALDRLER